MRNPIDRGEASDVDLVRGNHFKIGGPSRIPYTKNDSRLAVNSTWS